MAFSDSVTPFHLLALASVWANEGIAVDAYGVLIISHGEHSGPSHLPFPVTSETGQVH